MPLLIAIKDKARRLGFSLAGVTTPAPPSHFSTYDRWIASGYHGEMHYLANKRARTLRANPKSVLPDCKSIIVLAIPYMNPNTLRGSEIQSSSTGQVSAYAWGDDYHTTVVDKLQILVSFIEEQLGQTFPYRYYTDTGPILERDLAQRAGLGWIGKNTCLINPKQGSFLFLAEILLGVDLKTDIPFEKDHCGTCTRCIESCPTGCILTNRTIDARRCISYLTIEMKNDMPESLRPLTENWIFGCDVCQMVCPWNRFATTEPDAAFTPRPGLPHPDMLQEMSISKLQFTSKFKNNAVKRAKRRGYLRNIAVALGNSHNPNVLSALELALDDPESMVRRHASWAIREIKKHT